MLISSSSSYQSSNSLSFSSALGSQAPQARDNYQPGGDLKSQPVKFKDFLAMAKTEGVMPATLNDVQGPYYRPQAPLRTSLFPAEHPGERIGYSFSVVDPQGRPVPARVDVWTADEKGAYDMESPDFLGRAQADVAEGQPAQFEAIKPGNYDLGVDNQGNKLFRPAHVHVKVRQEGKPELTTQLYFPGDPWNQNDPILDPSEREGRGFDPSLLMQAGPSGQFSYQFVVR